jgi:hypothetical protein
MGDPLTVAPPSYRGAPEAVDRRRSGFKQACSDDPTDGGSIHH